MAETRLPCLAQFRRQMAVTPSLNQAAPRRAKQILNLRPRFCPCYNKWWL